MDFWLDVPSNSLASLFGAIVGIPVAFAIDRRLRKMSAPDALAEQGRARKKALQLVAISLDHNIRTLDGILKKIEQGNAPITIDIDLSSWESVKPRVMDAVVEVTMNASLARGHFRLTELVRTLNR